MNYVFFYIMWMSRCVFTIALGRNGTRMHYEKQVNQEVCFVEAPSHNLQNFKDLLLMSRYKIPQHTFKGLAESMPS